MTFLHSKYLSRLKGGVALDSWLFPLKEETELKPPSPQSLLFINCEKFQVKCPQEPTCIVTYVFETLKFSGTHQFGPDEQIHWKSWLFRPDIKCDHIKRGDLSNKNKNLFQYIAPRRPTMHRPIFQSSSRAVGRAVLHVCWE